MLRILPAIVAAILGGMLIVSALFIHRNHHREANPAPAGPTIRDLPRRDVAPEVPGPNANPHDEVLRALQHALNDPSTPEKDRRQIRALIPVVEARRAAGR